MHSHRQWLCIGAAALCMLGMLASPCLAQTGSVDQVERLLQMQQALQQQHAQQLSTLQLQLLEQERASAAQDWQWVIVCALALLGLTMAAWAATHWHTRRSESMGEVRPEQEHLQGTLFSPQAIDTAEPAFGSSNRRADHNSDDDWDSQMLADEALREFELRRTVGLMPETLAEPRATRSASEAHIEQAWADMQEVTLDAEATTASVDLSLEVQKVRKNLHIRRLERRQASTAPPASAAHSFSLALPQDARAPEPELPQEEDDDILGAALSAQPISVPMPEPPSPALTSTQPYSSSAELIFPASQRGMSEMEVRLALAQEFRRMGQIDEAEQLCNEALHAGNATEQRNARQLLESLPGR